MPPPHFVLPFSVFSPFPASADAAAAAAALFLASLDLITPASLEAAAASLSCWVFLGGGGLAKTPGTSIARSLSLYVVPVSPPGVAASLILL